MRFFYHDYFMQVDVASLYLQDAILPRKYADSHQMMLWWRPVALIASISLVWLTVSKAFEWSIAIDTVRSGGLF